MRIVRTTLQNDRAIASRTSTSARPTRARIKRPGRQLVRRTSPAGRHQGRVPRAAGRHQGRVPRAAGRNLPPPGLRAIPLEAMGRVVGARARVRFPGMEAGVGSKPRVRVDRVADRALNALGDGRRVVGLDVVRAKGSGSRLAGMLVLLAGFVCTSTALLLKDQREV